jgi:hypothetical protein
MQGTEERQLAYAAIRRKEKRTPARLGQEDNAADDVLMADQGHGHVDTGGGGIYFSRPIIR